MSGKTHCITAVAAAITFIQPHRPEIVLLGSSLAFLGGLTPDVDQFQSRLGRKVSKFMISIVSILILFVLLKQSFHFDLSAYFPVNDFIHKLPRGGLFYIFLCSMALNTKHRTFTHSILGLVLFTLCIYLCFPAYWTYFFVGYLSHLFLDFFNKEGMELFFPFGKKKSIPLCKSQNTYANTFLVSVSVCLIGVFLFQQYISL